MPQVFEEVLFVKHNADVMYMFFVTMVTQVTLGWVYYPIQTFEPFGGLVMKEIPMVIWNGTLCTYHHNLFSATSTSKQFAV